MNSNRSRAQAERAQQGAEREQRRISQGGVDPDYIERLEHFPGMSHAEIYAHAQTMDPGAMRAQAAVWVDIADSLSGAITGLHSTVQSALAAGMRGHIADAGAQAARDFVQWATDITEIAHSTGHRILAASYGAEAVRRTVPPPAAGVTGPSSATVAAIVGDPPGDAHSREAAREELRQVAIAAMEANYIPTYPPAGSGVPAFGSFAVADGAAPGDDAPEGISSSGTNSLRGLPHRADPADSMHPTVDSGARRSGNPNQTAAHSNNGQPSTADGATVSSGARSEEDTSPSSAAQNPGTNADRSTALTSPASTSDSGNPLSATASTDPQRATPRAPSGFPVGSPTPHTPSGLPIPGGSLIPRFRNDLPAQPDPGRSYPAPPPSGKPATPTPPTTALRSAAPSMGLLPGMHPVSGGPASDSDSSHRTPDWLVRDRQQELLGTPPPAVPAVLGAEIPSARTDLTSDPEALP
ncbi:hypothetical protein OHB26_21930 [Nocardia sp. NBC_01503]|uniref:hypothetical protein n=1 Tax=Nocardia sp. NBC_01503 TaxID=2975997 RepID=UPI002E7BCDA1|nr:hypothetical protein [Nocardia sp. NBC_01503]WTL29640.1 hypothetical protein OHB26_21930 [Nocardia sp. NBC_01503]